MTFFLWFLLVLNVLTIPLHMYNLMWLTREEGAHRNSLRLAGLWRGAKQEYAHLRRKRTLLRRVLFPLTVAALYVTIGLMVVLYITIFP